MEYSIKSKKIKSLSLKKKCNIENINLDDSFENLRIRNRTIKDNCKETIIVIDDDDDTYNVSGSRDSITSLKASHLTVNNTPSLQRPSLKGYSPNNNFTTTCLQPFETPSAPTAITERKSSEKCSIKSIRQSQQVILDELYGDSWKSIPTLFKKKIFDENFCLDDVAKRLEFDDSDKENPNTTISNNNTNNVCDRLGNTPKENDNYNLKKYQKTSKHFGTPKNDLQNCESIKKCGNILETPKRGDVSPIINDKTVKKYIDLIDTPETCDGNLKATVKRVRELTGKSVSKSDKKKEVSNDEINIKKLSFMGSLAENVPTWRCHSEALVYKNNFKSKKEMLTERLFKQFNEVVFNNKLDSDMSVTWDSKLRCTAGTTTNRLIKHSSTGQYRTSSIKLSCKVVDTPQRLRDTLIHEMCHAATWIVDHELRAGHGPLWKRWATSALRKFPELVEISRCHNMEIHYKYSYKCVKCGYSVNRHSKSIDVDKKCCGYCHGKFELIINKKNKEGIVISTPAKQVKETNEFAAYVKNYYGAVKTPGKTHAQIMKTLSEQYSASKNRNKS